MPSGGTVFELDFLDDVASDFEDTFSGVDAGQGSLTAEEKPEGEEGYGPGDDFTVQVKLVVDTPTFDTPEELSGYSVSIEEETGTINLSDAFGPIPPTVWVQHAPGEAWYVLKDGGTKPASGDIEMRLSAIWDDGNSVEYLLGTDSSFVDLPSSEDPAASFDMAPALNGHSSTASWPPDSFSRPEVKLRYEIGATSDAADAVDSITIRFEIPFALETVGEAFLDIEDDEGNNELAMDDDIFGRDPDDPDEDLEDFVGPITQGNELDETYKDSTELVQRSFTQTGGYATYEYAGFVFGAS